MKKHNKRKGILLILRKDELLLTKQNRIDIKDLVHKYFNDKNIFEKDSNAYKLLHGNTRRNQTYEFINNVAEKKLVITDRLHGTIFSVITSTPCIIFDTSNHKTKNSYNSWFKKFEYIVFMNPDEIQTKLEKYITKFINYDNSIIYDSTIFNEYYLLMKKVIQEKINLIK